jgi:hypothetical protein
MKIMPALLMLAFFAISSNAQDQAILGEPVKPQFDQP